MTVESWMRTILPLVRWKGVRDTVNRLGRAGRVQRAEDQVTCFRRRDGCLDRFQIAHFADEHDVRILPQHGAALSAKFGTSTPISRCVTRRLFVFVIILDRILDGDDVRLFTLVRRRCSIIEANVVVLLPEPVGPVTKINPRGL